MSKSIKTNEDHQVERFATREVIDRFTVVTEENVARIAKKIFDSKLQCVSSLQCDNLSCLESILRTECILYKVPLIYFLDGSYRRSKNEKRATYFGHVAVQLYTHLAQENKLPVVVGVNLKYIVSNIKLTVALQKVYEKISAAMKIKGTPYAELLINDPDFKDIISKESSAKYTLPAGQRFIIVPKDQIYCAEQYNINSNFLYCLAGTYHIIGAIGELVFDDGSRFNFKYEMDSTGSIGTAYSKNPLQFITTKFNRHAMKSYYNTRIPSMPKSTEDLEFEENDIIEASTLDLDMQDREQLITSKAETIAKKLKEIDEKDDSTLDFDFNFNSNKT